MAAWRNIGLVLDACRSGRLAAWRGISLVLDTSDPGMTGYNHAECDHVVVSIFNENVQIHEIATKLKSAC